mgnify:FL=1
MAQETRNAYGEKLAELIKQNKDVVVLDADLTKSTKTNLAKEACPERHFNAGIAECNMMGMAAGLAKSGKIAFASSFAIFLAGRAFEIIRNSICYPNLNVKVCATHAGLTVGEDGASHQAIEDIAIMRALPNMRVYVPCDQYETKALLDYVLKEKGPCYIRMGRGKVDDVYNENTKFDFSKISILRKGKDIVLFATGLMVQEALKAAEEIDATVVNVCSIKPIDKEGILSMLSSHKKAYALEEHNIIGGLFSAISEVKAQSDITTPLYPIGVNDVFGQSGKASDVLDKYGLTSKHIVEKIKN